MRQFNACENARPLSFSCSNDFLGVASMSFWLLFFRGYDVGPSGKSKS
jgi:hypothetical protein